jgi:DNA-3-methyladenine glycosylase II
MKRDSLNAQNLAAAAKSLAGNDPALARVLDQHGPPPLWKRPATFATLVRIILEQQVSLASAKSTFSKLARACDGKINAGNLAQLGDEGLRAVGFSRQKARYALALADDVQQQRFRIGSLRHRDDQEVRELITARLGLGDWSADVFLLMALCRPDVLPVGDLALVKGMIELDGGNYDTSADVIARAERWRPYRSVACRMVWQWYLGNRRQTAPS